MSIPKRGGPPANTPHPKRKTNMLRYVKQGDGMRGCCENDHELTGCTEGGKFNAQLSKFQLLKKVSSSWSY